MKQKTQDEQSFLTMKQVMAKLGVSRPTVYKLMKDGLPVVRWKRVLRFNPASLDRWIAEHEETAC